jgi:predicted ABC-type ATPase
MSAKPSIIVLAGPNGAGKSTLAPFLLCGKLGVTEFVNADSLPVVCRRSIQTMLLFKPAASCLAD